MSIHLQRRFTLFIKQPSLVIEVLSLKLCMVINMMTYHICHKLVSNMIAYHKLCRVIEIKYLQCWTQQKARPFETNLFLFHW